MGRRGDLGLFGLGMALGLASTPASAWPSYLVDNPNSLAIPWTIAIGHYCVNGGGPLNPYGWDFSQNSHTWNLCLACADSDRDGFTNGFELGDPCGVWHPHSQPPQFRYDISHPGNASSVPEERKVDWKGMCGCNPCEQSDVQQCTSKLDTLREAHFGGNTPAAIAKAAAEAMEAVTEFERKRAVKNVRSAGASDAKLLSNLRQEHTKAVAEAEELGRKVRAGLVVEEVNKYDPGRGDHCPAPPPPSSGGGGGGHEQPAVAAADVKSE